MINMEAIQSRGCITDVQHLRKSMEMERYFFISNVFEIIAEFHSYLTD